MTVKNSKINTSQLCVILIGIFLASRPILENSMQAEIVGNDSIITSIIAGLINLMLALLICYVIYKNPGESFYDIIKRILGKNITKVIMLLLSIVFFIKLLIIDYQMSDLLYDAIYSDINWNFFVIPVFLLFAYIAIKGIKTIGRCFQFFLPFAIFILVATLLISVSSANINNALPLFNHTVPQFFKAIKYLLIQSCEFIFLFTFMENVVAKKHYFTKVSLSLGLVFVLVIGFYILFILVLGNIAPFVQETLIKLTQFSNVGEGYFKMDIFTATMWIPIVALECCLCVYGISYSLKKAFNINEVITSLTTITLLFITKFIPQINTFSIFSFFYDTVGIYVLLFVLMLPILLVIASFKKEGKNDKQN